MATTENLIGFLIILNEENYQDPLGQAKRGFNFTKNIHLNHLNLDGHTLRDGQFSQKDGKLIDVFGEDSYTFYPVYGHNTKQKHQIDQWYQQANVDKDLERFATNLGIINEKENNECFDLFQSNWELEQSYALQYRDGCKFFPGKF